MSVKVRDGAAALLLAKRFLRLGSRMTTVALDGGSTMRFIAHLQACTKHVVEKVQRPDHSTGAPRWWGRSAGQGAGMLTTSGRLKLAGQKLIKLPAAAMISTLIAWLFQFYDYGAAFLRKTFAERDRISAADEDLHLVRVKIVDAVMDSLKFLAPATLVIAVCRLNLIGMQDGASTILLCIVMYIVALNKNRLNFRTKAISLIASITAGSLFVLFIRGLLSTGAICFLAITPSLAWIFFGRRATIGLSIIISACMGLIGLYTVPSGHLPSFDVEAYVVSPTAWIGMIAMTCICGWLLLFIFSAYAGSLSEEVRRHTLALQDANSRLIALSTTDGLTGLANRRQFDAILADEWARCGRHGLPLTLVMLDVDWFKKYNDCYGHQTGDDCLVKIARVLKASAQRASDLAARYGGEEFTLILPGVDAGAATGVAEMLRVSIELLDIVHAQSPMGKVTVSAGVATVLPEAGIDETILLRAADEALYRAKHDGRNRTREAPFLLKSTDAGRPVSKEFVQLAWRPAYECGHPLIDEEHRALFGHAADLLGAALSERREAEVAGLMDALVREVEQHFRNEEAILQEAGFPDTEAHAAIHRELLDRAAALMGAGPPGGGILFQFLAEDLVAKHVLGADREYFSHLKDRPGELVPGRATESTGNGIPSAKSTRPSWS
jgi:diguanylate cyclase (GGDEF)-like protein/hemerythrin-like metal-binding protein